MLSTLGLGGKKKEAPKAEAEDDDSTVVSAHEKYLMKMEAIEDAKVNSEINGIQNTRFYAGDMKNVLNEEFVLQNGYPDIVITDPPRAGMDEPVVRTLLALEPTKIVYVSCNSATQARDLAWLDEKYEVTRVRPVDMFPHTHHVENVVLLEKR